MLVKVSKLRNIFVSVSSSLLMRPVMSKGIVGNAYVIVRVYAIIVIYIGYVRFCPLNALCSARDVRC